MHGSSLQSTFVSPRTVVFRNLWRHQAISDTNGMIDTLFNSVCELITAVEELIPLVQCFALYPGIPTSNLKQISSSLEEQLEGRKENLKKEEGVSFFVHI